MISVEQAVVAVAPYSVRIRNKEYLDWVKKFPCARCGKPGPSDPHHLRGGGAALKCHDYETIPLCRICHNYLEHAGKQTFAREMEGRIEEAQIKCLTSYIHAKISEQGS